MPTNYNGDGTIPAVTAPDPIAISSSTNATPIVVTTSTSHGFATGDTVLIEGHKVNTTANGLKVITVLTANTFSINGSVGTGVGGATGYALDYAVNPLWAVPSGGDTRNASSVSTPLEAAANAVPFLFQRTGTWSIYDAQRIVGGTVATNYSTTTVSTSWTNLTNLSTLIPAPPSSRYLKNGDLLLLSFTTSMDGSGFTSGVSVGFGLNLDGAGSSAQTASSVFIDTNGGSSTKIFPTALTYLYAYSGSTIGITYDVSIMALSNGGSHSMVLWGTYALSVLHLRATS